MTAAERVTYRTGELVRVGAFAAVAGGALRVASSFIPYAANEAWLETLYGVIDLCLLFGTIAVYLAYAEELGLIGLGAFMVALAGLASIVGPDTVAFGVDFYVVGSVVFLLGLTALSAQMMRRGLLLAPAVMWIAALVFSVAGAAMGQPLGVLAAGLLVGLGFLVAGVVVLRRR